jgi:hypothetical protein
MSTTIRVSMCAGMIMVCSCAASGEGRPACVGQQMRCQPLCAAGCTWGRHCP